MCHGRLSPKSPHFNASWVAVGSRDKLLDWLISLGHLYAQVLFVKSKGNTALLLEGGFQTNTHHRHSNAANWKIVVKRVSEHKS